MPYNNYCELPTAHGTFRMYDTNDDVLQIITFGDIHSTGTKPIIRLHSSCMASEVFEARDCDCADQLREAMKVMALEKGGIIFYLNQEGRGQGLSNKIKAVHKMQTENMDTFESFEAMGLKQDNRNYSSVIDVLNELSITQVSLISNNPRKKQALEQAGITVNLLHTHPQIRLENKEYLYSKNDKLGHSLPLDFNHITDTTNQKIINFYHSDQAWGQFSNFSAHSIYVQGKMWRTAEHYYQAQKFLNPKLQERVRLSASPMLAKQTATQLQIKNLQPTWHEMKEEVMRQALVAKFTQHPDLQELLLSTQQHTLVEHTRNDSYWGDGVDDTGLNRLGALLMELRQELHDKKELDTCVE